MASIQTSRVVQRAKEAVFSSSKNESNDVAQATAQYNNLRTNLKAIVSSIRSQHRAMVLIGKTRAEISRQTAVLTANSPYYEHAGKLSSAEAPTVCSFASIHNSVQKQHDHLCEKYEKYVLHYAEEWEKVVVSRVGASLKKCDTLRQELGHYQQKVEALRTSINVLIAKGKVTDGRGTEKLARNEEKLVISRREYAQFTRSLCMLIDEVSNRCWIDFHPLLLKLAQFDCTMSTQEASAFAELNGVVTTLKDIGQKYGIRPEARLKDILNQPAQELFTGKETGLNDQFLTIGAEPPSFAADREYRQNVNGEWFTPVPADDTVEDFTEQVAGININGTDNLQGPTVNAYNEFTPMPTGPPPSRSDMLEIANHSAPPPTFDALHGENFSPPPPHPQSYGSNNWADPPQRNPPQGYRDSHRATQDSQGSHHNGSINQDRMVAYKHRPVVSYNQGPPQRPHNQGPPQRSHNQGQLQRSHNQGPPRIHDSGEYYGQNHGGEQYQSQHNQNQQRVMGSRYDQQVRGPPPPNNNNNPFNDGGRGNGNADYYDTGAFGHGNQNGPPIRPNPW